LQDINNLFIFAKQLKQKDMTNQEIKLELESLIYVFESLNNDYSALKLKAVLSALEKDWNESEHFYQLIQNSINE